MLVTPPSQEIQRIYNYRARRLAGRHFGTGTCRSGFYAHDLNVLAYFDDPVLGLNMKIQQKKTKV